MCVVCVCVLKQVLYFDFREREEGRVMHGCGYPGERLKNIVHDVRGYMFRIHSKYMRDRRTMM